MTYYATIYLKDGTIHLKPFSTKESAEECIKKCESKFDVEFAKVIKKDLEKSTYIQMKGHWIS